jgi:DNA-binding NtrC family response regulator
VIKPTRLLIIDGDASVARELASTGRVSGFEVTCIDDCAEGLKAAFTGDFDIVSTELVFDDDASDGMETVKQVRKKFPRLPVIVVTSQSSSQAAIGAIQRGAFDFLPKPVGRDDFAKALGLALEAAQRMKKPVTTASGVSDDTEEDHDLLIGSSPAMMQVYKDLGRVSATPATVLIRGETGTGKELIARAIYQHGHRAHQPFITINCAAIPHQLLESELFGHEKGAFTGADRSRVGRFEQAHNATLFLDEIGDMDVALQAKLLRVLQERQIRRLGGDVDIPVDVRIIAATHRNLEKMMVAGEFREDLFYRLNVATLSVPPLRHRVEDIDMLVSYFISSAAREYGLDSISIASEAVGFLAQQPWPGNVRQLQNVIKKAAIRAHGYTITRADVLEILADTRQPDAVPPGAEDSIRELINAKLRGARKADNGNAHKDVIESVERRLLQRTLELTRGNQAKASRWLGISRFTLREKLRLFGMHPADSTAEDEREKVN